MKTFTATELNKASAQVFKAAEQDGAVKINHDRYPDKVFIMEARGRGGRKKAFDVILELGLLDPPELRFISTDDIFLDELKADPRLKGVSFNDCFTLYGVSVAINT